MRRPDPKRTVERARRQSGFTVVEVLVAALIASLMGLAVLGIVNAATTQDFRARQSQVVNDVLQQEMEKIKQLPYGQVALTGAPQHSTDPASPNYRVSGTTFNVNRSGSASYWNLVYNGGHNSEGDASGQNGVTVSGGAIDPGPTPFSSGGVSGKIYRYVVWMPEAGCTNCVAFQNADLYNGQRVPWYKHVIVAVSLDQTASGGTRAYQELQSDIGNPDGPARGQGPPPCQTNCADQPWTFWITDTPCSAKSGYTESRQPLTGDHQSHNTRGACDTANGPGSATSGNVPGPPDLMFPKGAPCVSNDCSLPQPVYDYATDVEPGCSTLNCSSVDKGLQLLNGPSCSNVVGGTLGTVFGQLPLLPDVLDPSAYKKVHKWLSPAIPSGYDIVFSGSGEVSLWTRSVGGVSEPGAICVYVFYRQVQVGGLYVDTPAVNLDPGMGGVSYFPFSCPQDGSNPQCPNGWPTQWQELKIPISFSLGSHLLPGYRLGLAVSVDGSSSRTGSAGIEFMYDHPTYDSRISLNTQSLLPF